MFDSVAVAGTSALSRAEIDELTWQAAIADARAGRIPPADWDHFDLAPLGLPAPGGDAPGLAAMAQLDTLDLPSLSVNERLDVVAGWERGAAWVAAKTAAALATVTLPEPPGVTPVPARAGDGEDFTRLEVALTLGVSQTSADARLRVARALTRHLGDTHAALAAGEVSYAVVRYLVQETDRLDDAAARQVQQRLLDRVRTAAARDEVVPEAALRQLIRRAVATVEDPEEAAQRARDARQERRVVMDPLPDGLASLYAVLGAEEALYADSALDTLARRTRQPGDGSTRDARRADALVDALRHALDGTPIPGRPAAPTGTANDSDTTSTSPASGTASTGTANGSAARVTGTAGTSTACTCRGTGGTAAAPRPAVPVVVELVMDLPTLAGLADNPAELIGYGPLPAAIARELAAGGALRRLVTDPVDGHLLDFGTRLYRPPSRLAQYLRARDRTCCFPGCRRRATACDLDHATPYPAGTTSATNCGALCRFHHRAKTFTGWQLKRDPDGTSHWTSPAGRQYVRPPTDHRLQ